MSLHQPADPNMNIIKNDTPLWTWQHLEHYKRHRDVYGLELSSARIEQEIDLLKLGFPGRRYATDTECFDIYNEAGELVGDITLTPVNQIPELCVVIFDQYLNRGYAKKALSALIDISKRKFKTIEAIIKSTNSHRTTIQRILESEGFILKFKLPGGGLLFVLDLSLF